MQAQQRLDLFLAFSSEVTAFTTVELWGTGQAEDYLRSVDRVIGQTLTDELLTAYARQKAGSSPGAGLRREVFGDEKLGPIARNIVKLWYVGTWYALPRAWQEAYGPAPKDGTFVVSPGAYVEGLLWPAIGAHPPGAKPPGFGHWRLPPKIPDFA